MKGDSRCSILWTSPFASLLFSRFPAVTVSPSAACASTSAFLPISGSGFGSRLGLGSGSGLGSGLGSGFGGEGAEV